MIKIYNITVKFKKTIIERYWVYRIYTDEQVSVWFFAGNNNYNFFEKYSLDGRKIAKIFYMLEFWIINSLFFNN